MATEIQTGRVSFWEVLLLKIRTITLCYIRNLYWVNSFHSLFHKILRVIEGRALGGKGKKGRGEVCGGRGG